MLRRYEARMRTACDNEFRQSPRRIARELTALAALPAWFVLYNSASALTASAKSSGDSQRIIFFFLFIPTITVYALISTIYHSRRRAIMRRWHTTTCLRCHYPINTPPSARCPECGIEFPHILFPP